MPRLSARPLLAILAAGLAGFALGYASEAAAAEKAVFSGGSASFSQGTARSSVGRAGRQAGLAPARRLAFSGGTARSDRRGYRALERARNLYETEGSLTHVRRGLRDEAFLDGLDEADEPFGGGYDLPYPDAYAAPGSFPSKAKIIDIGHPAPGPVDTVLTGSTKIIRIAPDDRRQHERARSAAVEAGDRQPWSSGWLTHCMAAYASFDPALGTYVAGDGRVRFCEAE